MHAPIEPTMKDGSRALCILFAASCTLSSCGGSDATPPPPAPALRWIELPLIGARWMHSMFFDEVRQTSVVFGGHPAGGTWVRGSNGAWTPAAGPMPPERSRHATAFDAERRVGVLFGGTRHGAPLDDTWEWNGQQWIERQPATKPPARAGHQLAFDPIRRRVLLFGGLGAAGALGDTWEWTGSDWRNLEPEDPPAPRLAHAMCTAPGRGVVMFGGGDTTTFDDTWLWNGTSWEEIAATAPPPPRGLHTLAPGPLADQIVLFGGATPQLALDGETWVLAHGEWRRIAVSGPSPRAAHACVLDAARRQVVLFGGAVDGHTASDTWTFDGTHWTQAQPEQHPPARQQHAIAAGDDGALLFGGDAAGPLAVEDGAASLAADTWVWRSHRWEARSPGQAPPARRRHALAFDDVRRRFVLFGGTGAAGDLGDTWEFDGSDWLEVAAAGPSARAGHAMAYDPTRRRVLLFGGRSGGGFEGDTWEWNGAAWSRADSGVAPSARNDHALAWHGTSDSIVLFGGFGEQGGRPGLLADTWVWDGARWHRRESAAAPPARSRFTMASATNGADVVLYGGEGEANDLDDCWRWDGRQWQAASFVGSPGVRCAHTLTRLFGQLVVFGGLQEAAVQADTWILDEAVAL
jgi:hypothetical protein